MITPSPICSRSIHIEILLIVKQCFGNEVGYSLLYFNDEIEFCVQRSDEMTMIVKVLFFAKAKELCGGVTSSSFELTGPTTTEALVNEHVSALPSASQRSDELGSLDVAFYRPLHQPSEGSKIESLFFSFAWKQLKQILKRFPQLESIIPICVLSLNLEYVEDVRELSDGDEIALIPPISGG